MIRFILICMGIAALTSILMAGRVARAADFIQYTAPDGTLSFTDDPRRVPAAAENILERDFAGVRDPFTTALEYPGGHRWSPPGRLVGPVPLVPAPTAASCPGRVVDRTRIQVGDRSRNYWVTMDGCGNLRSISRTQPRVVEVLQ